MNKDLLRHTALYLPAQILVPLTQVFAVVVWAKILPLNSIAEITLLTAIQDILFSFCFRWWTQYVVTDGVHSTGEERVVFLKTEAVILAGATVVHIIAAIAFAYVVFQETFLTNLPSATAFLLTRFAANYFWDRSRANQKIFDYSILNFVSLTGGFLIGLVLIPIFGANSHAIFYGFAIAQLVSIFYGLAHSDVGRSLGAPSVTILTASFKYGGLATASQVLTKLSINSPRFLVAQALGLDAAGIFAIGYNIGIRVSSMAVSLVTSAAYPLAARKLATEGIHSAYKQLSDNMTMVWFVVMPAALGVMATSAELIQLGVDEKYRSITSIVLPLATLAGMARFLRTHATDQVFLISKKTGYLTLLSGADLVVCIALTLYAMQNWGVIGAAVAPFGSGLVSLALSQLLAKKQLGFTSPLSTFLKIVLASGLMYLGVIALGTLFHEPVLGLLFAKVMFGALIYGGLSAVMFRQELSAVFRPGRFWKRSPRG